MPWQYGIEQDLVWILVLGIGWLCRSALARERELRLKAQRDLAEDQLAEARDEAAYLRGLSKAEVIEPRKPLEISRRQHPSRPLRVVHPQDGPR